MIEQHDRRQKVQAWLRDSGISSHCDDNGDTLVIEAPSQTVSSLTRLCLQRAGKSPTDASWVGTIDGEIRTSLSEFLTQAETMAPHRSSSLYEPEDICWSIESDQPSCELRGTFTRWAIEFPDLINLRSDLVIVGDDWFAILDLVTIDVLDLDGENHEFQKEISGVFWIVRPKPGVDTHTTQLSPTEQLFHGEYSLPVGEIDIRALFAR
jgi:hypothetical protein